MVKTLGDVKNLAVGMGGAAFASNLVVESDGWIAVRVTATVAMTPKLRVVEGASTVEKNLDALLVDAWFVFEGPVKGGEELNVVFPAAATVSVQIQYRDES